MTERATTLMRLALMMFVIVGGWAVLVSVGLINTLLTTAAYGLASALLTIDALDMAVRIWQRHPNAADGPGPSTSLTAETQAHPMTADFLRPYAVIASVHNATAELEMFMQCWWQFKDRMWLIDDASTDGTALRVRQAGWRCLDGRSNRKKPGAIKHLLQSMPREIETVIVIDPDMEAINTRGADSVVAIMEKILLDFQRSKAAAFCPRLIIRPDGFLVTCQGLEYVFSNRLGRKSLGAAVANCGVSVYRRSALEAALEQHSLSVYAEDFENSVLILSRGETIYFDDRLVLQTEGKRDWRSWFSQRVGWSFGWVKVYFERWRQILLIVKRGPMEAYHYGVYLGFIGLILFPLKVGGIFVLTLSGLNALDALLGSNLIPDNSFTEPAWFAVVYLEYLAFMSVAIFVAVPRRERLQYLAIIPVFIFYAIAHVIPMLVGFFNLVSMLLLRKRLYDDHYDAQPALHSIARSAHAS